MTKREKLDKLHKGFRIASVCRQDIVMEDLMTEKEALALDDNDMDYIADKMYDGIDYWACLSTAVELLKNSQKYAK